MDAMDAINHPKQNYFDIFDIKISWEIQCDDCKEWISLDDPFIHKCPTIIDGICRDKFLELPSDIEGSKS